MTAPLVLLPGMMCDARLFAPQIAAIHDRAVMVAPITGAADTATLARNVLAHAPPRFALAGLSMGGIVAMEVAALAPDRIAGLALMDTNSKAEHPDFAATRPPQIARAQGDGLAGVMRDELMPHYLAPGSDPAILDLCLDMALGLGPDVFDRQSRALATRADRRETLSAVTVPSLILCGREDAICPVHRHTDMAERMPDATLCVIDGAGHLPTLERPDAVTQALRGWLARVDI